MWNGHPSNDRRLVTMDLRSGRQQRRPTLPFRAYTRLPDSFGGGRWLGRIAKHGHTLVNYPALIQGQGFEQVGEETLYWYAPWPEQSSDGVRVASWPRDRLGYLQPFPAGRMRPEQGAHVESLHHWIDLNGRARATCSEDREWHRRIQLGDSRNPQRAAGADDQVLRPQTAAVVARLCLVCRSLSSGKVGTRCRIRPRTHPRAYQLFRSPSGRHQAVCGLPDFVSARN